MHLCNGRNFRQEKALGFNGAKCYVRDSWGSPLTTSRVEELRGFGCFFEQMKIDILQSQVFGPDRKMVSGCTLFRNGITYQTNAAIQNICFGLSSLLFHYAHICPFGSIFLGDITTDHNERHFNNLKSRGAKTAEQMALAEKRGNYHNVLNTALYVKTGVRSVTSSLKRRKVERGNCVEATDEHLHMAGGAGGRAGDEAARMQGGGGGAARGAEEPARKKLKKKPLAPLRVNPQVLPIAFTATRPQQKKVRLRQGGKNQRGVRANGVHVAPCSL